MVSTAKMAADQVITAMTVTLSVLSSVLVVTVTAPLVTVSVCRGYLVWLVTCPARRTHGDPTACIHVAAIASTPPVVILRQGSVLVSLVMKVSTVRRDVRTERLALAVNSSVSAVEVCSVTL